MKIDANVIDRIVAKIIYDVEWWDYIGAEVSDDQWRLMMMGRLAGISEFANALKGVLNADCKDEPQTDCAWRYGDADTEASDH